MKGKRTRNWPRRAARWGALAAAALAFPMLGYSAPPTKVILPTSTMFPSVSSSYFGHSIASSANGSIVVVGADNVAVGTAPNTTPNAGAAFVYVEPAGHKGWGGTLPIPVELVSGSPTISGEFGKSVAISSDGSRIVVGEPKGNSGDGAVWVFDEPSGGWASEAGTEPTDNAELYASGTTGTHFGASVAISADGNTVVVGAPLQTVQGETDMGTGYVFTYTPSTGANPGSWSGGLDLSGATSYPTLTSAYAGAEAGVSVAIAGNGNGAWIFLGAPYDTASASTYGSMGSVMAFQLQSSTASTYKHTFYSSDINTSHFGFSVAAAEVAGSTTPTLVVGAPWFRTNSKADVGEAFVYQYSSAWTLATSLIAPTLVQFNQFGNSVAISSDGTRIEVSSLSATNGNIIAPGIIYQYDEPSKGKTLLGWSSVTSPTDTFEDGATYQDGFAGVVAVGFTGRDTWVWGNDSESYVVYVFKGK